ncbi:uncharacterized protein CbrC (UPF0167 family) [Rhodococcus sp. LBL1]|nr:uncharacterized protein CbrC (UPF0167 family) [Rhodococcus sp. LBL1]MDH6685502.1 uncharacterized protein CbrC (UPF0167 family) [Rhodococcus sp. LBL2]
MDRSKPPAPESDISACEAAMGFGLPAWLGERLGIENGWTVDDKAGLTREEWRFLPVLDRSDRKSRTRTAEDIAWHTRRLRATADVPPGSVVVARAWSESTRLILLPGTSDPTRLGPMLWRQNGVAEPMDTPIDAGTLGRLPEPKPGSRLRAREELPSFTYHPDPVATGAITENPAVVCPCCGLRTGWEHEAMPYGRGDQPQHLCPWCIADGSAHARFGSEFVSDIMGEVPPAVVEELNCRTPGFVSWQGERWMVCCGDAAVFLGCAGWDRLQHLPDALACFTAQGWPEERLWPKIDEDCEMSAYLFRCRHCGRHLAYADAS